MERPWNRTVIRSKPRWALLLREQLLAAVTLGRAAFAGTAVSRPRFVVHSLGRSGSTLLTDLLSCHPGIECDGEILSHRLLVTSADRLVRDRARLFPSRTYGFKMRPRHYADQRISDPAAFLVRLHAEGWRILHLERSNLLRIALSWVASRQSGIVHRTFRDRNRGPSRTHVPIDLLQQQLARVSRDVAIEQAALAGVPHLRLSYEHDLVDEASRQPAMDRVFEYLDLPPAAVSTRYVRLSSDSLEETVENYEEVVAALAGTPHQGFLSS